MLADCALRRALGSSVLTGVLWLACCSQPLAGRSDEIQITGQYPPAEIRLQHSHFLIINRGPIPQPGRSDQWIELRNLDWTENFRAAPGEQSPEITSFSITSGAIGPRLQVAVAGRMASLGGETAAVIVIYDSARRRAPRVMKTSPILCSEIAFDPKGDLWCLGTDLEARKAGDQSYPMIYRYSSLGSVVAKGVPRNSIKASASPELDSSKGSPRIFFGIDGRPLVLFPIVDMILELGSDAREADRWQAYVPYSRVNYTAATTGEGRLIGLLPTAPASGIDDKRYRLHELVTPPNSASNKASRWTLLVHSAAASFAGFSNELVGIEESRPVIWNRTDGRLIWLPSVH